MSFEEMSESEPLMKYRNSLDVAKSRDCQILCYRAHRRPDYCMGGDRYLDGMNSKQAFFGNTRTCRWNVKGTQQVVKTISVNTNVRHRGRAIRSSEETSVMEAERRNCVSRLEFRTNLFQGGVPS